MPCGGSTVEFALCWGGDAGVCERCTDEPLPPRHIPAPIVTVTGPTISAIVITIVPARITGITGAVRGAIRFADVMPLPASSRLE